MAKRLHKEITHMRKNLEELTGKQAEIIDTVSDDVTAVLVRLTPTSGYYRGDVVDFKLEFHAMYPIEPPVVTCLSDIYHPNIDTSTKTDTNVCLNLLDDDFWCSGFGLQGCIFGLLFLLENPNFDDPISPFFVPRRTDAEYIQDIRNHREGKQVGFIESLIDEVICSGSGSVIPSTKVNDSSNCDRALQNEVCSPCFNEKRSILPYKLLCCCIGYCRCDTTDDVKVDFQDDWNDNTVAVQMQTTDNAVSQNDVLEMKTNILPIPNQCAPNSNDLTCVLQKQVSEDNIVEASNNIFLNTSKTQQTDRQISKESIDEKFDFEEMMYKNFDTYDD